MPGHKAEQNFPANPAPGSNLLRAIGRLVAKPDIRGKCTVTPLVQCNEPLPYGTNRERRCQKCRRTNLQTIRHDRMARIGMAGRCEKES
jgi:hypothetical protein